MSEDEFHVRVLDDRSGNPGVASIMGHRCWYLEFLVQWSQVDVDFVGWSEPWDVSRGCRVDVKVEKWIVGLIGEGHSGCGLWLMWRAG